MQIRDDEKNSTQTHIQCSPLKVEGLHSPLFKMHAKQTLMLKLGSN